MLLSIPRSVVCFAAGVIVAAVAFQLTTPRDVKASVAMGNDKFSMCTVPVAIGESEAVFALNHLTGVLSGAALNNTTGTFTHRYLRNIAADFQGAAGGTEPKYAIVSGPAQLRSAGRNQPANGVLYIGELSSGAVIAYTFAMPRGPAVPAPLELAKIDFFTFAESVR